MISPLVKMKAIELRVSGKSLNEIKREIGPIAKSTLSLWLKNISLSKAKRENLAERMKGRIEQGRLKTVQIRKIHRLERIAQAEKEAKNEFQELSKNPLFSVGIGLYLGEGSKTEQEFKFTNSDPNIIRTMIYWLKEIIGIDSEKIRVRLQTYTFCGLDDEVFWKKTLSVPEKQFLRTIYKPSRELFKKKPEYHGCIRIEVNGRDRKELFWKIIRWRDMLYSEVT